ncbi:IclR family transcriptional regulator [Nitrospirillum viridazoti]|uniref:IclR family transcriptional regulator n=1 Tax=Nitrospirillum viridazoti CBAmc TaxID=1441467 RepID=A0A248JU54_9PROT|nr:helix-turn-helix domain-containing protein [Nitrospirillum amazonense]ASG22235.1 IclR family transcriptional regulator [Nitrospirillum amazonense CBAmc]TWB30999.1 IclR family transcriptional regulator [Nitrospirillum amazonense]
MSSKDMRTVKSAHRALEILEYFDSKHRTATVMDLSRSLAYPQSSTSELLRCLTQLGYLHYNRYRRTYTPTARVAFLGSWVDPKLFRGGTILNIVDRVAEAVGETVVLSTANNYVVQHLHVVEGPQAEAVQEHAGNVTSLLHSPQGKLLLATYQEGQVRSALHRLNAEESDVERRVRIAERAQELARLRTIGWLAEPDAHAPGIGVLAAMLLPRRGMDRLVLSVLAPNEVIEARKIEIIRLIRDERRAAFPPRAKQAPVAVNIRVEQPPVWQEAATPRQLAHA